MGQPLPRGRMGARALDSFAVPAIVAQLLRVPCGSWNGRTTGETEQAMAGRLTTHVLDTTAGRPGAGIAIELYRIEGGARRLLKRALTNDDGRCDAPLLAGDEMTAGVFELVFELGAYFRARGQGCGEPAFLDQVPIRFGIADPGQHYHVPLVATPFAYSTYRGS